METAHYLQRENRFGRLNNYYRFRRHFYDLTRSFFLPGRNELLLKMNAKPGENVLEAGCGTGRNLLKLSRLAPQTRLFGLDASDEMLKTAAAKFDAHDKAREIILRQGWAEEFDFEGTFGLVEPFDKIFISYSLSMCPEWRAAFRNSLENLKPGGSIYVVDFWDGALLPERLNRLLHWWLGPFKVPDRGEFLDFLDDLETQGAGQFFMTTVGRRYAYIVHFQKSPAAVSF